MNGKYLIPLLLGAITCFVFAGCDNFEGNQQVPSYIKVKGFNLVADDNLGLGFVQDEGFLSNEISDVWVFVTKNGKQQFMGAYTLKDSGTMNIPVLEEGISYVELRPGIKYNGMNGTREYYSFYTRCYDTVDLQPVQVAEIPVQNISYNSLASISQAYMFEDNYIPFENLPTVSDDYPDYMHLVSGDSVSYGSKCAALYSSSSSDIYKVLMRDSISCANHNAMILEMDYHSNIDFEVGLYGKMMSAGNEYYISCMRILANDNPDYAAGDRRNWKKMYIILGKVWGQLNYNAFKLWLQPVNNKGLQNGFVHIDNIKIIHFPE